MPVSPINFGAVPYEVDPLWDSTAAVQQALDDGRAVWDPDYTFNVTGVIGNHDQKAWLALRDIGGNRTNMRTLYFPDGNGIDINVTIDRNGDPEFGVKNTDAGLWIEGPLGTNDWAPVYDARVRAVIKGAGRGCGAVLNKFIDCDAYIRVKELTWAADTMPTDDLINGVWIRGGSKSGTLKARARDCGGYVNGVFTKRAARNIVSSKSEHVVFDDPRTIGGSVGLDLTGGDYNYLCQVIGGQFYEPELYGLKMANSAYGNVATASKIIRPGSHGVVISGPLETPIAKPNHNHLCDLHVLSPGFGGKYTGHLPAGFMIMQGSVLPTHPANTELRGCFAQDDQNVKTMYDGFRTQTTGRKDSACKSIGHTHADFDGPLPTSWTTI